MVKGQFQNGDDVKASVMSRLLLDHSGGYRRARCHLAVQAYDVAMVAASARVITDKPLSVVRAYSNARRQ